MNEDKYQIIGNQGEKKKPIEELLEKAGRDKLIREITEKKKRPAPKKKAAPKREAKKKKPAPLEKIVDFEQTEGNAFIIEDFAFSSDGKHIAGIDGADVYAANFIGFHDGSFNSSNFMHYGHKAGVTAVALSPDDRYLATGSADSFVRVFDLNKKNDYKPVALRKCNKKVLTLAFSPDGKCLAAGGGDSNGFIRLFGFDGKKLSRIEDEKLPNSVRELLFSKDGEYLITSDYDLMRIFKYDHPNGLNLFQTDLHKHPRRLAFSPDGKHLAVIYSLNSRRIFSFDAGYITEVDDDMSAHTRKGITFSPDGKHIAVVGKKKSASDIGYISISEFKNGQVVPSSGIFKEYPGETFGNLVFSPDGKYLAVGNQLGIQTFRVKRL